MSAMSLEAEKNELIRRILDVDDVAILRRVKSMLSCEEEQTNVVAEESTYCLESSLVVQQHPFPDFFSRSFSSRSPFLR